MKELSPLAERTASIIDKDRDDELYSAESAFYKGSPNKLPFRQRLNAAQRRFAATKAREDKWRRRAIIIG